MTFFRAPVFVTSLLMACATPAMQESVKQSKDFVRTLDVDCTLTHGYVCADTKEDDFLSAESWQRLLPGLYLEVWKVCYEDFQTIPELDTDQKRLRHYNIGFTENNNEYIVLFQGLLLPAMVDGKPQGIIRATFGLSTKYWVDKKTLSVKRRLFLR